MMRLVWKSYCAEWRDAFMSSDPIVLFLARVILIGTHVVIAMALLVVFAFAHLIWMAR